MDPDTNQIISDFNNTLLSLAQNVAAICPMSIIGTNIKDITKQLNRAENFTKFIDLFCVKVLQYKDQIDEGKESFFMDKDYSDDLKDVVKKNDTNVLNDVISLKSVWNEFKKENKQIVILNMQILCELAQLYFNVVSQDE